MVYMVVLIGLLTAIVYGAGDFCGGLAAKRTPVVEVVAVSHIVGLVGAVVASVAVGAAFRPADIALGGIGGIFGGLGVWLLYRRLASGPMQVVAPLTAVTSAVIPTAWGFATGERLSLTVTAGLVLALIAIALVSRSSSPDAEAPVTPTVVAESLLAGSGFGAFFILLDATDPAAAPWPIAGARLFTAVGLTLFLVRRRAVGSQPTIFPRGGPVLTLLVAVGILDTLANAGFLWATTRGSLAVASVLTSLYPVSTVLLARYVLGERMNRWQQIGFVGAVTASAVIGAG